MTRGRSVMSNVRRPEAEGGGAHGADATGGADVPSRAGRATAPGVRRAGRPAPCGTRAVRGSSGPSVSSRSRNSWRASGSSFTRSSRPSSRASTSVGRPRRRAAASRASASSRRVSGVSGIRPSRVTASSVSPRAMSRAARAGMATGWSGSSSRARRSGSSAPASAPAAASRSASDWAGARPLDERPDRGLGLGADELVDHRAVPDGEHGRDRLDLEAGRHRRVLVDVDLDQLDRAVGGRRPPARGSGRASCTARTTGAQRSTTTGTSEERSRTASSNVASVTSTMVCDDTGRGSPVRATGRGPAPATRVASGHGCSTERRRHRRPARRRGHRPRARSPTGWPPTSPASVPPFDFELIAGGRSNLTYRVTDARRPRLRPAPAAGQPRAAHRPRHGPRAHRHQRPRSRPTCPSPGPSACAPTPTSTAPRST